MKPNLQVYTSYASKSMQRTFISDNMKQIKASHITGCKESHFLLLAIRPS